MAIKLNTHGGYAVASTRVLVTLYFRLRISFQVAVSCSQLMIHSSESQAAFDNVCFCRFKNSENAPIYLLCSDVALV